VSALKQIPKLIQRETEKDERYVSEYSTLKIGFRGANLLQCSLPKITGRIYFQ